MIGSQHSGPASTLSECIGPLTIPPGLMLRLRSLAQEAGADDFAPLVVCATVLAGRLSWAGAPRRAKVIYGQREADTPTEAPDPAAGFRAALAAAARYRPAAADRTDQPADVSILVSADGCLLFAESTTDAADACSARGWAQMFLHQLTCLTDYPDAPMDTHPLMSDDDRERLLNGLNPHRDPVLTHSTLTEPFEEQTRREPHAVALVDEYGGSLSYLELNERANRLAHFLMRTGAGPGGRVGICLSRGIAQITAIYAVVKTGAAYVPLDAELPNARLAYMLEDCAPTHVLTDPACRDRLPDGPWLIHDVESGHASWEACPATNPAVEMTSAATLNILYTSGSTGVPKGVAYPADGALAHLAWMQSRYPFSAGDTALFKTSPGFDVSIWEIFWPLYHGARLLICRPDGHKDPRHLAELAEAHGITTIFLPPTIVTSFLSNVMPGRLGALRWVLCGGEPITPRIRDRFHATVPATSLVNCYGPTEAGTVTDGTLVPEPGVPVVQLGRPAEHFRVVLLDENLEPVPVGMPGEVYIGGRTGLAHGYWRAPGRTAERFIADPGGPPGSRLYRTGDLCRYLGDGVLEHLGRIDRQIKLRGMRVEPGEIESVLTAHPAVADCAVVVHGDPLRLVAFVVPADPMTCDDLNADVIREHAAALLPDHMRPERVIPVARIPATVNGKMDRTALLVIWQALVDREREVVPADHLEARLASIYSRVLEVAPVSMLGTLTELGGNSMLAFQLLDECQQQLRVKPAVEVLLTGTIRDVAASIREAMAEPGVVVAKPES
ncbi:MAG: non-ribosomal peptide synthetase [Streptosporangiaceae bacterium]|jgi:amino acid adenylation domain-containing protein